MACHLGIDVGTSSLRVSVVQDGGAVLARSSARYAGTSGPAGEVEQDPADWLRALRQALDDCSPALEGVAGVGIVGQTPTLVAVGLDGDPVRPAMTWQDTRAATEAASEIVGLSIPTAPAAAAGLYTVPASCAPLELVYGPTQAGGAALEWIAGLTGQTTDAALAAAARAPSGSTPDPVFVPYLSGERAPIWCSDVLAVFMGLAAGHRAADLVRSVLSGVALSARHVLTVATDAAGRAPGPVHVGGRGVASPAWAAARLRGLGVSLLLHDEPNLSALGAAMLGAAATGRPLATTTLLREDPVRMDPTPEDVERAARDFAAYLEASSVAQSWSRS